MTKKPSLGVLLTRPQSQSEKTAEKITALDPAWVPYIAPLMRIMPMPWAVPSFTPQALIITSLNATSALARLPFKAPVHVVGTATAEAVRDLGFDVSTIARNGDDLAQLLADAARPEDGPLLYLSGVDITADFTSLLAPKGLQVIRQQVYRTEMLDQLPLSVLEAIDAGQIGCALVYSRKSLEALIRALPVHYRAKIAILCLSEAICDDADAGFRRILCAAHPNEASLLDLLDDVHPKPAQKGRS